MTDEPQRDGNKDPAPIKHSDAERASEAQTPPDSAQKPETSDETDSDAGTES